MADTITIPLSTQQCADTLGAHLGRTITNRVVLNLTDTGALTDIGPGRSVRVASDELNRFVATTRYVTPDQWPADHPLYRVSLLGLHKDPVRRAPTSKHPNGKLLREWAGADYANAAGLSPKMRRRAWTGVWPISEVNANRMVAEGAIIFGTTKGYIHPDYVRQVTGYERVEQGLVYVKTRPAPAEVTAFVGDGLWMNVAPGSKNAWAN